MATSVDTGAEYEHAAPFTPVPYVLSFTDLCYSIKKGPDGVLMSSCLPSRRINRVASTDNNTRALLSGISGEARQGELFAVMGASGSGKSTLVDALAGRIARDSLQGTVTLNGEPLEGRRLRAISAYVMQEDLLHPMLTVRETLLYAAELRLSRALSPARKKERVDALLDQLGLTGAADTVIGDEAHRGVSGGERRRVSIGKDIVHDPILLVAILVTGLILSTIFLRLDDTPKGVKERLGFFAMALTTMYYVCTDRLQVFIQERHIYMRETAHNAYRPISYVLANAVVSFPPLVIMSLVFAVTTFFPVGLAGGVASFAFFSLVVLSSLWAGTGLVIFLSAALPHVMLAYTVVAALIACFRLLSGFFINRDRIPSYCSATPSGDTE